MCCGQRRARIHAATLVWVDKSGAAEVVECGAALAARAQSAAACSAAEAAVGGGSGG